jgi:hypothetical protein
MKRFVIALLSFITLASLAHAELVWKKDTIKYMAKPSDEEVTGVFYFVNEGKEPVKILQAKSSCGCTVVDLEKDKEYAPGEMGELRAKFTFGEREGQQIKQIRVLVNDKKAPFYTLTLDVTIPTLLKIEPQLLSWDNGEALDPKTSTISVLVSDPIDLILAEPLSEDFDMTLTPVEQGRSYTLSIKPKPDVHDRRADIKLTMSVLKKDGSPKTAVVMAQVH